ncbi:restriction endonuclease [Rhodococcus erythropolis]|uniref:restriction endonuclease n=1 Tax=Rhodococcus erythropolis TaxID=1833 RepID=UPI0024BAF46C|nr:restriction endonuclease [Rhodococcus erythropolis]
MVQYSSAFLTVELQEQRGCGPVNFIRSAREAEENAAEVMRAFGYLDAKVTDTGPDGGLDIVSSSALAQVKWKGAVAGRPELQRLVGARGRQNEKNLFFFSASGYSQAAVDYANDLDIALFLYDPAGVPTAQNRRAHAIIQSFALTGGVDNSDEMPAPPILPTAEETAAEIVKIVKNMTIRKFNSFSRGRKLEIRESYREAIIIAENLLEKFNSSDLEKKHDQMFAEKYGQNLPLRGATDRHSLLNLGPEANPFRRFGEKSVTSKKLRIEAETPLNPIFSTHFNAMPFKYDSGRCFAFHPKRDQYEEFDRINRQFAVPYDPAQADKERKAAIEAQRLRRSAARLRNL